MSATKQYELVYIVAPEATEEQVADLHTQIEQVVTRYSGTIDKTENWGRRRLAYPIGRHKEGIYVLELISGGGDLVKELDRRLKVLDVVVRHLVVRVDEDLRIAARAKELRKATSVRRRTARGLPPEPTPEERMRAGGQGSGDDRSEEAEA
jgi:small subunit ribosomal protein S6